MKRLLRETIRMLLTELPGNDYDDPAVDPGKPFSKDTIDDLARFVVISNDIEGYNVEEDEVKKAVEGLLEGYPLRYVTNDPHIFSHLSGLKASSTVDPKSVEGARLIHREMGADALDAGAPGILRATTSTDVVSSAGKSYVDPTEVGEALDWWESSTFNDPFEAHTVYEMIHPFDDGNGRSGRIILAAMMNYDYDRVNSLIGSGYFNRLNSFDAKYQGEFWKEDEAYEGEFRTS